MLLIVCHVFTGDIYILQCKVFSRAAGDILLYPAAGDGGGHIRLIASITSMTCS